MTINQLHPGLCLGYMDCRRCWLAVFDDEYRAHYSTAVGYSLSELAEWLDTHPDFTARHGRRALPLRPQQTDRSESCIYLGPPTGEVLTCPSCAGNVRLKVRACAKHGKCTLEKPAGVANCKTCQDYSAPSGQAIFAQRWRFDEKNLFPEIPGKRLNASIMRNGDHWLICFRNGWKGSNLYLGQLDDNFKTMHVHQLEVRHKLASYGREDPRLFRFPGGGGYVGPRGEKPGPVSVALIGVHGKTRGRDQNEVMQTHQLYSVLGERGHVLHTYYPDFETRQDWEKNWEFFVADDGNLYAVYSIHPHKVVRVHESSVYDAFTESWPLKWSGGELRGGASPVRVGDEFYCFFHGRAREGGTWTYNVGVYTFDARPPFAPLRITPHPILVADRATKPADQWAAVVFPCGAELHAGRWFVSYGVHDRWVEIAAYDPEEIERRLVKI